MVTTHRFVGSALLAEDCSATQPFSKYRATCVEKTRQVALRLSSPLRQETLIHFFAAETRKSSHPARQVARIPPLFRIAASRPAALDDERFIYKPPKLSGRLNA
ncbi:MAG: hypothetical protein ACI9BW_003459 [Gammaproteobacteria bacterium]|jgi:hypothetical protein